MNPRKLRRKQTMIVQKETQIFHMKFMPQKCFINKENEQHPKSLIGKLKSIVIDNHQNIEKQDNIISRNNYFKSFSQIKYIVKLTSQRNPQQESQEKIKSQKQINDIKKSKSQQKINLKSEISSKNIKNLQRLETKKSIDQYETWIQYILIGNQNQVNLMKIQLKNQKIVNSILWSLSLDAPIKGVKKCKYSESKLILWTQHKAFIYSYEKKNLTLKPKQIKIFEEKKIIYSIQFLKRNIFIVCFKDGAKIYEIYDINFVISLDKHFQKTFKVPEEYKVFSIPELIQNEVKIFYIQKNQHEQQPTFRLHYVSLEHFFNDIQISDIKKVYDFKKNLQKEISIYNYTKSIFLINLRSQIIAIKNGMIIDNMNVNFKGNNLFLKIISRSRLVHFLQDKIEIYKYSLNLNVMPQKIQLYPVDSITFQRDFTSTYLKVVQLKFGYGVFFQNEINQETKTQLQKGIINYWFGVTIGVQLKDKLDSIFPSKEKIQETKLQILQQKCDMAMKMGLTQDQAYLQLWKRSKQQSDKDFDILMNTKNYQTVLNEIILIMKKSSMKFRLLKKIETMCCDMLRERIYNQQCCFESIKQYASSHFLLLKLEVFKDIQVQTKKYRKQEYAKNVKPNQQNLKGILNFIKQKGLSPKSSLSSFSKNPSEKFLTKNEQNLKTQEMQKTQTNLFPDNIFLNAFFPMKQEQKQEIHGNKTSDLRKIQIITQTVDAHEQNDEVKISIKDYYLYRDCHIKQHFMSIIIDFMGTNYIASDCLKIFSLRAFMRVFRLQFRLCYEQILIQLLKIYKTNIKKLLQHFPQFLPFKSTESKYQENLYYGIWNSIQKREIQSNLFTDDLITIQNKQIVSEFINNIWYRRNHNSHHSVITRSKNQIIEKFSQENLQELHQHFFYLFYSNILQLKKKVQDQVNKKSKLQQNKNQVGPQKLRAFFVTTIQIDKYDEIIKQVQTKYKLSPRHLKGKIFLYQALYYYLKYFNEKAKNISLYDFLHLKDFQLFQIFFKVEKQKKGFLIKSILPIYQKISQKGKDDFIAGINSFFRSEKSQVTDLKTILNRLNNQKTQFHYRFQKLYEVLIQAIMNKIKVGTENDIPIQQLLIYIENIPFSLSKTKIIQNLSFIQEISYQVEMLSRAKLNLSIKQIQQKAQQVITALVKCQLNRFDVINSKDEGDIKLCFYKIISQIQCIKGHLYGDQLQNFSSFVFITQLIQKRQLIPAIKNILQDQFVIQNFQINQNFYKSVVFYSIRKHMTQHNQNYLQEKQYIFDILSFLPAQDKDRKFIQYQIKYCQIFQRCNYKLPYPLSMCKNIPNLHEIEHHIRRIESSQLQKLDINEIFQTFQSLRNLLEPQLEQDLVQIQLKKRQFFKQLFEIAFSRFLKENKFKQAIKIIQQIMLLKLDHNCIIYPILLIDMIFAEVTQKSQCLLAQLVSYFFYQCEKLTEIIKHLINYPHTSKQFDDYIIKEIKSQKKNKKTVIYNKKNFLLRSDILKILKDQQNIKYEKGFCKLIQYTLIHLLKHDQCLQKNKQYNLIYRIICHQPFLAVKFLYLRQNGFNIKIIRQFLSFLSTQIIFQPLNVLKYGKFIMQLFLNKIKNQCSLDQMIKEYQRHDINYIKDSFNFLREALNQNERIIYDSIQIMKKKLKFFQQSNMNLKIQQMHQNAIENYQQSNQRQNLQLSMSKKKNSLSLLQYPKQILKIPQFKYMYHCDQDDAYANRQQQELQYFQIKKWNDSIEFDDFKQRHEIHVCQKNSLFSSSNSRVRNRKKSEYLPQSFHLQVSGMKNLSSLKVQPENNFFDNILTKSTSQMYHSPPFLSVPNEKNNLFDNILSKMTIKQQQHQVDNNLLMSTSGKIGEQNNIFGLLASSMRKYKIGNVSLLKNNKQMSPAQMKSQIFGIVNQSEPLLDLSQLNQIKNNKNLDFKKFIIQVCKLIYQSQEKPIKFRVCIINQILNNFNLPIRFNILKIFVNASKIKFINQITLPFIFLFPFQNLLATQEKKDLKGFQKDEMKLFKNIKDKIMKVINSLNLKNFSQLVLYAFGKNSYHDEIYYQYMLKKVQEALQKYKTLNQIMIQGGKVIQKLAILVQDIIDMDYFKNNLEGLKSGTAEDFKKYKIFDMGIQKMKLNQKEEEDLQSKF